MNSNNQYTQNYIELVRQAHISIDNFPQSINRIIRLYISELINFSKTQENANILISNNEYYTGIQFSPEQHSYHSHGKQITTKKALVQSITAEQKRMISRTVPNIQQACKRVLSTPYTCSIELQKEIRIYTGLIRIAVESANKDPTTAKKEISHYINSLRRCSLEDNFLLLKHIVIYQNKNLTDINWSTTRHTYQRDNLQLTNFQAFEESIAKEQISLEARISQKKPKKKPFPQISLFRPKTI